MLRMTLLTLPHQDFEGAKIEPRYYVPVLPMLAINGSEGVSHWLCTKDSSTRA